VLRTTTKFEEGENNHLENMICDAGD